MSPRLARVALGIVALVLAGCASDVGKAPHVTAILPERTCDVAPGDTRELRVSGQGLVPSVADTLGPEPRLRLPSVALQRTLDENDAPVEGQARVAVPRVRFTADGALVLTLPGQLQLPRGTYDVLVTAEGGGEGRLEKKLRIGAPPSAFFVDPRVVWGDVGFELTGWLDAAAGAPSRAVIQGAGQPARELVVSSHAGDDNRFSLALPAGLPAGPYDLTVTTEGGCVGVTTAAFRVEASAAFVLNDLEPDVGVTGEDLPVTLSGVGFAPTPRMFLVRQGDPDKIARPLLGLDWQGPGRVDAVVPDDTPAGTYDLVAIAADDSIGSLPGALTLVTAAPLQIDAVTPLTLPPGVSANLEIRGSGFDPKQVRLRCRPPLGGAVAGIAVSVTTVAPGRLTVSVPQPPTLPAVCIVRVVNQSGAVAQFSAITFADAPASKAFGDIQLGTARRALGLVITRIRDRHFLFAIGGDDGTTAGALDSVDSCKFDLFGRSVFCRPQRTRLSTPRSFVGAANVGRFVYAIGGQGRDGQPLTSIDRAVVLSPEEVPRMADHNLTLGDGTRGLTGGQWIYRISAKRSETDETDSTGETLASQPALVVVPERAEKVRVTLSWVAVTDAMAYRIYRTAAGDLQAGEERLVVETTDDATVWTDDGLAAGTETPIKPFQLSQWQLAGELEHPRAGAAVVTARDPENPAVTYLYVAGGRDGSPAKVRDDLERFTITENGAGVPTFTGPVVIDGIGGARAQLSAWSIDAVHAPSLGADTWIYFGGGQDGAPDDPLVQPVVVTVAGKVLPGGGLELTTISRPTPADQSGGAAALVRRDGLVLAGGGGVPSRKQSNADLCDGNSGPGNCDDEPGALTAWTSAGGVNLLVVARHLMAVARSGPLVFIVGGQTGAEPASRSLEGGAW